MERIKLEIHIFKRIGWIFAENVYICPQIHQITDMRYKIKKETKPTLPTFGKYKAVAVHNQVVDSRVIAKEACRGTTLSPGAMEGLMMTLGSVVMRRLQMGDKVRLAGIGLLKLEIESEKVDDPKQFRAQKHIRGVRLHLIPESEGGRPELYKGITFERDKSSDI